MDKRLFHVYLAKECIPNNEAYAKLNLPASPWKVWDAMEKVRLQTDDILYMEIEDYFAFEYLAPHLDGLDISLNELNDLAAQLAALDEVQGIAFEGLFSMEVQKKVNANGGVITLQDLRDLAVSAKTDCYHVVDAADDGELTTVPPCPKELPEKPEYLFRLTLGLHPDIGDERTVTLELPASEKELEDAQERLGTLQWENTVVLDYDGIIPNAAIFADLPIEIEAFNEFAKSVKDIPVRQVQLPKLKALLEQFEVQDIETAILLAEHLDDYILTPELSSPQETAVDQLRFLLDDAAAERLLPHVNLFTYGNEVIQHDNAALTSYGLLHREDYQPMQTQVQERFEMDMQ